MLLRRITQADLDDAPDAAYIENQNDAINKLVDQVSTPEKPQSINLLQQSNVELIEIDVQVPDPWYAVGVSPAPSFQNSWTGTAQYMKSYDGQVELILNISAGVAATAFTMPPGFIPKNLEFFCLFNGLTGAVLSGQVRKDGTVQLFPGSSPSPAVTGSIVYRAADVTPIVQKCFPVMAKTSLKSVVGMVVVGVSDAGSASSAAQGIAGGAWSVDFTTTSGKSGNQIRIKNILGLPYNRKSHVKLLAIGGAS